VKFVATKKRFDNKFFFTPLFCCCFWIRDPEWVKIRIRDKHPGSAALLGTLSGGLKDRMLQVTSYKEVAEHVGLLSGSSSEEEKDKEEEVEDITDFDQGLPLLLIVQ
jgi:hypothetical protein